MSLTCIDRVSVPVTFLSSNITKRFAKACTEDLSLFSSSLFSPLSLAPRTSLSSHVRRIMRLIVDLRIRLTPLVAKFTLFFSLQTRRVLSSRRSLYKANKVAPFVRFATGLRGKNSNSHEQIHVYWDGKRFKYSFPLWSIYATRSFSNVFSHFVLQAVSERLELAPAGGRSEPQVSTMVETSGRSPLQRETP